MFENRRSIFDVQRHTFEILYLHNPLTNRKIKDRFGKVIERRTFEYTKLLFYLQRYANCSATTAIPRFAKNSKNVTSTLAPDRLTQKRKRKNHHLHPNPAPWTVAFTAKSSPQPYWTLNLVCSRIFGHIWTEWNDLTLGVINRFSVLATWRMQLSTDRHKIFFFSTGSYCPPIHAIWCC